MTYWGTFWDAVGLFLVVTVLLGAAAFPFAYAIWVAVFHGIEGQPYDLPSQVPTEAPARLAPPEHEEKPYRRAA